MTPEPDRQPDDTDLVTLLEAANEFEAQTIISVLREAEIPAVLARPIVPPLGAALRGKVSPLPVRVLAGDLERARTALEARRQHADSIDWDDVDVGERADALPLTPKHGVPLGIRLIAFGAIGLIGLALLGLLVERWVMR